jgi:hypothetical protein
VLKARLARPEQRALLAQTDAMAFRLKPTRTATGSSRMQNCVLLLDRFHKAHRVKEATPARAAQRVLPARLVQMVATA